MRAAISSMSLRKLVYLAMAVTTIFGCKAPSDAKAKDEAVPDPAKTEPAKTEPAKTDTSTEEKTQSTAAGVTPATGDTLTISGSLALTGLSLADAPAQKVLLYTLLGGKPIKMPKAVDVDDKGVFNLDISKADDILRLLKEALAASPVDRAKMKDALPGMAADIDQVPEEDLLRILPGFIKHQEALGGPQYVLISMTP